MLIAGNLVVVVDKLMDFEVDKLKDFEVDKLMETLHSFVIEVGSMIQNLVVIER